MTSLSKKISRLRRIIIPAVIAGIIGLAGSFPAGGIEKAPITVTFIANCGFLLEGGGTKILFDLQAPDRPDVEKLLKANQPPFNDIPLILISHSHPDHLGVEAVLSYLGSHPKTRLYSTDETRAELEKADRAAYEHVRNQIGVLDSHEQGPETLKLDGLTLEAIGTWHAGAPQYQFKTLCFSLNLQGREILYLSDIDPGYEKNLPALRDWKAGRDEIDLMFVPDAAIYDSPYSSAAGREFIRSLGARHIVPTHINPREFEAAAKKVRAFYPGALFFRESLEKKTID